MNQECEHTLGLKVSDQDLEPKALYCIKKATNLSLSEIKKKISEGDYLQLTEAGEIEELQNINRLKRELAKFGIAVKLYQDDEEESYEYFDNIEKRTIEIAQTPAY